jgi:FMN phosphatase YigB (HAD superfamily)
MKNITKNLLLIVGLFMGHATLANEKFTPQNTVLVFDVHDVLVELSPTKATKAFINAKYKAKLLKSIFKYLSSAKTVSIEGQVVSGDLDNTSTLELINPHVPKYGTFEVIKKLKSLGYKVYICSNIGEKSYKHLQNQYPDLFSLFDGHYVSASCNNYQRKTSPQAFIDTCTMIDQNTDFQPEHIVFVDNSRQNLKLACLTNPRFHPIMFFDSYQLQEELKALMQF